MFIKHYAPNRCGPSIEVIMKIDVGGGGGGGRVGGEGGCARRIEVFVKSKKKSCWGGGGVRSGGQGGCERRIEVFVKIQKKSENYKIIKKNSVEGGGGIGLVEGGGGGVGRV